MYNVDCKERNRLGKNRPKLESSEQHAARCLGGTSEHGCARAGPSTSTLDKDGPAGGLRERSHVPVAGDEPEGKLSA
eukprot:CAMPEP_0170265738 /NCGR_PEP_ID=MMETSP0116_2-20130129/32776_1 /TAXON_ID=400756 /ORGANISM="Durinskia baltica, Strain CSIRO CS-38" /LENGTH=76 /DNA_ID=CAMNT_0010516855 /DNA_START=259 /DNA_END=486 /DNA_ORIENTATION=+